MMPVSSLLVDVGIDVCERAKERDGECLVVLAVGMSATGYRC